MKLFHKYECTIFKLLDSSEKLGKMGVLCFRTVCQVPLEELIVMHNALLAHSSDKSSPSSSNPLLMGFTTSTKKLDSSHYSSVFAQTTNSDLRTGADLLKRTYAAIYLTLCLRFVGYFNNNHGSELSNEMSETEVIVASVLLRHLQSASCNAYGVNHIAAVGAKPGSRAMENIEVGGGTFPMISTTNHSCNPNIYRFNVGKRCVVKSLVEIKQGEEILDSYGPGFTITSRHQRQNELENQYCFKCQCVACCNNWPTFEELRNPNRQTTYRFSCPHCDAGQFETTSIKDKQKCQHCNKLVDFKKLQKLLKSAGEKYARAKDCVLKQKLDAAENIEKHLCNYILAISKVMIIPTKESVEAQEVLKLFYNLTVRNGILTL